MYPFDAASLAQLWDALRARLRQAGMAGVPAQLSAPHDLPEHWQDPHLLLSQACGYPVATLLRDKVTVLGALHFDVPGCDQSRYSSTLLVRGEHAGKCLEQMRGKVAVCNERHSQSGYHALRSAVAPLAREGRFFAAVKLSGAHRHSARMVAHGQADIAALDAVSADLLRRQEPAVFAQLVSIGFTAPMPGLPLITARTTPVETVALLRQALKACTQAAHTPHLEEALRSMRITGFSELEAHDYQVCAELARRNHASGLADW
ncbi:MAG: PhnD/SsuA/transferrin family substrate-binding protein [Pseudomonadota bacterium]